MEEHVYIEILVEDKSGEILVEQVMQKFALNRENFSYKIHSFKGIGKIPLQVKSISQLKTGKLLNDLPGYLKGISASLKNMPGRNAIFVVLDNDEEDCAALKNRLTEMYRELAISTEVFFCIAVEEIEAWLLGDANALQEAYPAARKQLLQRYVQDSIIGTWEFLADIVYKGGYQTLKRNSSSYYEIGLFKIECAEKIGAYLDIRNNASPSFNYFIRKLDTFCSADT